MAVKRACSHKPSLFGASVLSRSACSDVEDYSFRFLVFVHGECFW